MERLAAVLSCISEIAGEPRRARASEKRRPQTRTTRAVWNAIRAMSELDQSPVNVHGFKRINSVDGLK
jgi:hypothetical protein